MEKYSRVVKEILGIIEGTALILVIFMTAADIHMRAGGHPVLGAYEMVALMWLS
jgi:hypothetical protein